jgi:pimeloyl-ACP methyl ester carboxylesterase
MQLQVSCLCTPDAYEYVCQPAEYSSFECLVCESSYSNCMVNAWIQRLLTVLLLLSGLVLCVGLWPHYPWVAALCLLAPVPVLCLIEAVQFVMLYVVNRHDPTARASLAGHVIAWWSELCASVVIFNWWQPFRRQAVPDNLQPDALARCGVVLVHGFFCNRGLWTHWMRLLKAEGRVYVAVDLEPSFGSIDDYVDIIDKAVTQVTQATGQPPLVIGHSMGGLALRAWLSQVHVERTAPSLNRVHHVITLGTPHYGTWLGVFSHTVNGSQMRLQSDWLRDLQQREKGARTVKFTCFYSNCDNIVFPVSSAKLDWADNRLVKQVGHVAMVNDAQVMQACWKILE